MAALDLVTDWPVEHVGAAIVTPRGTVASVGDIDLVFALASLTKPISSWAILVGVEEGIVSLDEPLDRADVPDGATLRHLLAHAAGFGFTGDTPISPVERRRIYSNTGIERAATVLSDAADISFDDYVTEAILHPLGMTHTTFTGSPAFSARSTVDDMAKFLGELLTPTLLATATVADATNIQYPGLAGIVPGVGRFDPCPWGLGVEILGSKSPHWMGRANSPATFGHFGGAGTMMWVDPAAEVGVVALTDRRFDDWAAEALVAWPLLSDAVVAENRPLATTT